ncbi:hypothetical protein DTL42_21130 [Bremerella cremea]|uniref:Uncharacterized protein n=1 Tax=Bremerella cremea TaxID=1031537 RepID=A0A368KJY9_9BACT|nr:hypothetical protein DTL42_21130 [Bremerella cremea]
MPLLRLLLVLLLILLLLLLVLVLLLLGVILLILLLLLLFQQLVDFFDDLLLHRHGLLFGLAFGDALLDFAHQTADFGKRVAGGRFGGRVGTKTTSPFGSVVAGVRLPCRRLFLRWWLRAFRSLFRFGGKVEVVE